MSDSASSLQTLPEEAAAEAQADAVFARIAGEALNELPQDLYIPPEALRVFLDAFEGPLDLLLYLIRRHNLDILAVNVAAITHQYIAYVELMKASGIDLAAEYLLMAATLAEIKSRSLLPRQPRSGDEEGEEDPTAQLLERLQAYERLKSAAGELDQLPRFGRDWYMPEPTLPELTPRTVHPDVSLDDMLGALGALMARAALLERHQISRETLSTRERMSQIMDKLSDEQFTAFEALFTLEEGREGVVVSFMAILELAKERMIEIVQNAPLSPLHVRARAQNTCLDDAAQGDDMLDQESPFD